VTSPSPDKSASQVTANSQDRAGADARKKRAALLSVFASGFLAILKLLAGVLSGSLALLSEAVHATIDLGATIVTFFAIKEGAKPADDEHHYGHGKIEAVAALAETGLLFVLSAGVAVEAARRLFANQSPPLEALPLALGVLIFSIITDFTRWRQLSRIARETKSQALEADALHFSSDILSSLAVLIGICSAEFGIARADSVAALIVAIMIGFAGWKLGRRTIDTLVDAAPKGSVSEIRAALAQVRGVIGVPVIRVRSVGSSMFAEVTVQVPRLYPLERADAIKAEAQSAIRQHLPDAEVTVTAEPRAIDDETVLERVLLIAARRRTPVHHVTVQEVSGQLSVSLDIEVDGRMSLAAAHQIASKLEAAIAEELGAGTEVETHIEPLEAQGLSGNDATETTRSNIEATIRSLEANVPGIGDVHSVRVRETERGMVVSLHVHADPTKTVEDVHGAVDTLERAVKQACPEVIRIVSHAEPRRD
jgi:cation diffusion facilitator family transporter